MPEASGVMIVRTGEATPRKRWSAPRPPFVGLALMAAMGIITAEIFPLPSIAVTPAAIILAVCILIFARAPRRSSNALCSLSGKWHADSTRRWQPDHARSAEVADLDAKRTLPRSGGRA